MNGRCWHLLCDIIHANSQLQQHGPLFSHLQFRFIFLFMWASTNCSRALTGACKRAVNTSPPISGNPQSSPHSNKHLTPNRIKSSFLPYRWPDHHSAALQKKTRPLGSCVIPLSALVYPQTWFRRLPPVAESRFRHLRGARHLHCRESCQRIYSKQAWSSDFLFEELIGGW